MGVWGQSRWVSLFGAAKEIVRPNGEPPSKTKTSRSALVSARSEGTALTGSQFDGSGFDSNDSITHQPRASMEPLPFESGMTAAFGAEFYVVVRLQWSRSLSRAECNFIRALVQDKRTPASMEPLPFESGMYSKLDRASLPTSCFNGAAPFRERNDQTPQTLVSAAEGRLQWSRSLSRAE